MDQRNLLDNLTNFNDRSRPKAAKGKNKKRNTYKSAYALYEVWELTLNAFKSTIFSIKKLQGIGCPSELDLLLKNS